jgi:hypothetical protein
MFSIPDVNATSRPRFGSTNVASPGKEAHDFGQIRRCSLTSPLHGPVSVQERETTPLEVFAYVDHVTTTTRSRGPTVRVNVEQAREDEGAVLQRIDVLMPVSAKNVGKPQKRTALLLVVHNLRFFIAADF